MVQPIQFSGVGDMSCLNEKVGYSKILRGLRDFFFMRTSSRKHQLEFYSILMEQRTGFKHSLDILFPVHLPDEQEDGVFAQMIFGGNFWEDGRFKRTEIRSIRHYLDIAGISI